MSGWGKDASTGVEWDYERRLKARDERIRELEQENERLRECVLACGEAVLCEGNWRDLPDMVLRSIVKYVRENARTAPRQSKSGAGEGGRGMSDCKHKWVGSAFDPIQCACCGMMLTAWQARRIRELEQRLAAVEGLPVRVRERMDKWALRINVENGRMVPPNPNQDGEWITVRMAHKMITDELQAALHPKAQNAEDCAE